MLNIPNDKLLSNMIFRSIGNLYPFDENKEWENFFGLKDQNEHYYLYRKF